MLAVDMKFPIHIHIHTYPNPKHNRQKHPFLPAAVTQSDENNHLKPAAFASVKFSPTQSKWATIEKEA